MPSELVQLVIEQLRSMPDARPLSEAIVPAFPHGLRSHTEESMAALEAKSTLIVDKDVALSIISHLLACADKDAITEGEVHDLGQALNESTLSVGRILTLAAVQSASLNLTKKAASGWPIQETWCPTVDIGNLPENDDIQGLQKLEDKVRQIAASYGTELAYETGFYLSAENVTAKITADEKETLRGGGPVCEELKPYWAALSLLERTDEGRPFAWKATLPSSKVRIKLEQSLDPNIRYESKYALNTGGAFRKYSLADAETGPQMDIIVGAEAENYPSSDIMLRLGAEEGEGVMDLDYVLKGAGRTLARTTNALTADCALLWSWTRLGGGDLGLFSDDENRQVLLARHVASTCKSQNVNAVYTAHHLLGVWLLDGGVDESITMELRPEFPAYKVEEALNTLWPTSRAEDLALLAALKDSGISFDEQIDKLYSACWQLRHLTADMESITEAISRDMTEATEEELRTLEGSLTNLEGSAERLRTGLSSYEGTLRSLLGTDREAVMDGGRM